MEKARATRAVIVYGTTWPRHYGRKQPRIQTEVLGHSLVRSLIRSHRSLIRLLRTARFARCSLVRSLAHFAHSLARGKVNYYMAILSVFFSIFDHSESSELTLLRIPGQCTPSLWKDEITRGCSHRSGYTSSRTPSSSEHKQSAITRSPSLSFAVTIQG